MAALQLRQELETAEARHESERLNLEQLLHQCEREKDALIAAQAECQTELSSTRVRLEIAERDVERLKFGASDAEEKLKRLQASREQLMTESEQEKIRYAQLLERTAQFEVEIDRIREDCSFYSEKQLQMTQQVHAAERALSVEKAILKPLQFQLADIEQQKSLLAKQNEALNDELEMRSEQFLTLQRKHGAQVGELTSHIDSLKVQCSEWERRFLKNVEETSSLESRMVEVANQVQEEKNACASICCQYQGELDAEKRVSATYKRSLNALRAKVESLETTVQQLRTDNSAATESAEMFRQKSSDDASALAEAKSRIDFLTVELQRLKDGEQPYLQIQMGEVSLKDVTVDDIYGRLVQCSNALINEQARSRKLELYLEQIQVEVNEQLPLLQEQRSDYENVLKVNQKLAIRVQEANHQRDVLQRKLQDAIEISNRESAIKNRLLERLRFDDFVDPDLENPSSQQLLIKPNEERDESSVDDWRLVVHQLEDELKNRDLKLARLETQILSIRGESPENQLQTLAPPPSTVEAANNSHVNELRIHIEMLQKEKQASEYQLQQDVDDARRQHREAMMKLAACEGEVALAKQKLEWANSQVTRLSQEAERLRSQDAHKDVLMASLQEKVTGLSSDLTEANQRYTRTSVQLQQTRMQLELAAKTEERLSAQCGDLSVLRRHNEQLLSAMESVQSRLDSGESKNISGLAAEKEKIYQDWLQSQKQSTADRRNLQQNIKVLEQQCATLHASLEVATRSGNEANEKLAALSAAAASAEAAHADVVEQLRALKKERDMLAEHAAGGSSNKAERQLMTELAHTQAEVETLHLTTNSLKEERDTWKAVADERLQALNEQVDRRQRLEADVVSLKQRIQELTDHCHASEQQYNDIMLQLEEESTTKKHVNEECQAKIAEYECRVEQAELRLSSAEFFAKSKEQEALDYMKRYETELTGHAKAISGLNELRDNLTSVKEQLEHSRAEVDAANVLQNQAYREIAALNDQVSQARDTINSLTMQNDLLLSQLESGRSRIVVGAPGTEMLAGGDESEERTRQIVSHLRSEKEIAEAEAEAAKRQALRFEIESQQLRSSLQKAQEHIVQLQDSPKTTIPAPIVAHDEYAVLLESNQMLRSQKLELIAQCSQMERRILEFEESVAPMQLQISELNATVLRLEAENSVLVSDVQRWKDRNQQLLSRYNQIDPELYRQAQQSFEDAKKQIEELEEKLNAKESRITELQAQISKATQGQVNIDNIRKSALFNLQQVNQLKRELQSRPDPSSFVQQLADAQKCIKTLRELCLRSKLVLEKRNETVVSLQFQLDTQKQSLFACGEQVSELQERLSLAEERNAGASAEIESLQQILAQRSAENADSQGQVTTLRRQLIEANQQNSEIADEVSEFEPVPRKRPSLPEVAEPEPSNKKAKTEPVQEVAVPTASENPAVQPSNTEEVLPALRRLRRQRPSASEQPSLEIPVEDIPPPSDVAPSQEEPADLIEVEPANVVDESDAESGEIRSDLDFENPNTEQSNDPGSSSI